MRHCRGTEETGAGKAATGELPGAISESSSRGDGLDVGSETRLLRVD